MRNGDDTKFDKPAGSSRSSWRRAVRHLTGGAVSLLIGMSVCVPRAVSAEAIPSGIWLVSTEVAIQIFDCSGKLCGRVIWLKKPLNLLGLLKRDKLNPDPALRLRHVCGPTIIWNLRATGSNRWEDGWFYNPDDGITYRTTMQLKSADLIEARVYLGLPIFGETRTFVRVPPGTLEGLC